MRKFTVADSEQDRCYYIDYYYWLSLEPRSAASVFQVMLNVWYDNYPATRPVQLDYHKAAYQELVHRVFRRYTVYVTEDEEGAESMARRVVGNVISLTKAEWSDLVRYWSGETGEHELIDLVIYEDVLQFAIKCLIELAVSLSEDTEAGDRVIEGLEREYEERLNLLETVCAF